MAFCLAGAAASCATSPNNRLPKDPWEGLNRSLHKLNRGADLAIVKPIAVAYEVVVPRPVQYFVTQFFANVNDVPTALNHFLQGEVKWGFNALSRVSINTTLGGLGLVDVASRFGMPRTQQDFGQTLARYGYRSSKYFVLPLLGPSTIRDGLGKLGQILMTPTTYIKRVPVRTGLWGLQLVQTRANLLISEGLLSAGGVDEYSLVKGLYQQKRELELKDSIGLQNKPYLDPHLGIPSDSNLEEIGPPP